MTIILRAVILLLSFILLPGCGSGGLHLPRPDLYASLATIDPPQGRHPPAAVTVEFLAKNATDAPLWLRRLDITLTSHGADLAAGIWDGNRLIDPGTSLFLEVSLPLLEPPILPTTDTPGSLLVKTRYARSGILGLMGGESFTYELPIVVRTTD
ncbi:hypothetical protein MNBD_PLANCTO03-740 [hydrothermal vent metagenome]|uniref:Uncharacterized protein n=1 Tax=hydrothermal vent metagenome TaxID=652676 RepID=A0A3B1D6N3_9ZZZZ